MKIINLYRYAGGLLEGWGVSESYSDKAPNAVVHDTPAAGTAKERECATV